jgi:2-amino-4-hydroxy-6-hydroxymethyldihydropteridine diphosphokinase
MSRPPGAIQVFVGLGSNQGDPRRQIETALSELPSLGASVARVSHFYRTEPVGGEPSQPWYVNAVAELVFRGEPLELLRGFRKIESRHGRVRSERNAPRTLDLDILLFGDRILESDELTLPHPRFRDRKFVLVPLAEIAPEARDPSTGLTIRELLARCPDQAVVAPLDAG